MTLPFSLPDWLPWWATLVILVPVLLYVLVFLLMPFSVIGVKGRLDALEAQLDDIQQEIRTLTLRLPEGLYASRADEAVYDTPPLSPQPPPPRVAPYRRAEPAVSRPPIPPAPVEAVDHEPARAPIRSTARPTEDRGSERPRTTRNEPRLDWPR